MTTQSESPPVSQIAGPRRVEVQLDNGPSLVCQSPVELAIRVGDLCVLRDDRLLDFGKIASIEDNPTAPDGQKLPVVLRRATLQDQSKARENVIMAHIARELCAKKMAELHLEIHLIYVRYSFDRTMLSIYFMSEDRVDFRDFVKALSAELKAQVEMKQVGVRDTARLIGGLGPCGLVLCCKRWLQTFEAVSVKMAKVQRLSLSPNTISGMCGRLKCCLRYEHDCYRSCSERFPRDGAAVRCPAGNGYVADKDILRQRVKVRLPDNRLVEYDLSEIAAVRLEEIPAVKESGQ